MRSVGFFDVILILLGLFEDQLGLSIKNTSPRASWLLFFVFSLMLFAVSPSKSASGKTGNERSTADLKIEVGVLCL